MCGSPPLRRRSAVLILALCTSARAAVPNLGPLPIAQTEALQAAATTSLAPTAAQWPAADWWQQYRDPQLNQLITEALAGSPDLEAAAARIRVAQGLAQRAGAALKPTVDTFGVVQGVKFSQNGLVPEGAVPDGWNGAGAVGVGLSFNLDLWGKNRAALRAAKLDAEAARFEADAVRLGLTTGIASAYAELAALYAQHDSLEAAIRIRIATLQLVSQRVAEGLDNQSACRQASAKLESTKLALATTDEAIGLTKNALAALVGTGPDRALTIERPVIAALTPQGVPANAAIDLIGRRPDIAAARTRVVAASENIKVARADFYPNVNLYALAGAQAFGLASLFTQGSGFGSAGPAITLPIFHGGAIKGQYRARRGQYDEAVALYDQQVVSALHETADALTSQKQLTAQHADARAAAADFEAADRLARLRYSQGLATYLDVLSAEQGVIDSRLAVARLETRGFALDVALVRALGGGFNA